MDPVADYKFVGPGFREWLLAITCTVIGSASALVAFMWGGLSPEMFVGLVMASIGGGVYGLAKRSDQKVQQLLADSYPGDPEEPPPPPTT